MWFVFPVSLQELKTVKLRVSRVMPSMLLKELIYSLEKGINSPAGLPLLPI